jgi:hypothetical protein
VLYTAACSTVTADDFIVSWKQLNKDLIADINGGPGEVSKQTLFSWEYLKRFKTSQRIEKLAPSLWLEMAKQPDGGPAQLVAYYCIAAHSPQYTTDAALAIAMSSPSIILDTKGFGPAAHLRDLESTPANMLSFSAILCAQYNLSQRINLSVLLGDIREEFLEDWCKKRHLLAVSATNESQVVDRLLASKRQLPKDLRSLLLQKAKEYSQVPGSARVVYLRHSDPKPQDLIALAKLMLVDEDIHDVECVLGILHHADYFRRHLSELSEVEGEVASRRLSRLRKEFDNEP